jgi:hypothetical protein
MKKLILICAFFLFITSLWAEIEPRVFEVGVDADAGFANNFLAMKDIFTPGKAVEVNIDDLAEKYFSLNASAGARAFVNVDFKKFQLGLSTGVEMASYGNISEDVTKLLANGNVNNRYVNGEAVLGGSLFYDLTIGATLVLDKWKFGLAPAGYIPLLYVPKPSISMVLDTRDTSDAIFADVDVDMDVYSAFSLETGSVEISEILGSAGFDLSLSAEYALFPLLDLGATVEHIPLIPATLSNRMHLSINYDFEVENLLDQIMDGDVSALLDDNLNESSSDYFDNDTFTAFRPLRANIYAYFKPFESEFITLKPNLGFSALTVYGSDQFCFNAGVEAKLNLINLFVLSLDTGYVERLWRHKFKMAFNLHVIELNLGLGFQSQDFQDSFLIKGMAASLGLRLGI